ncbi:MAG: alpha/beta hydrolase [Aureispira sp.]
MRYILILISIGLLIAIQSCRLDDLAFNPTAIEEYLLEDSPYKDERVLLPDSYDIDPSLIDIITLQSGNETIYTVYIGDKSRIGQDTVILYCHGNSGNMDSYWERAKALANAGGKNRFGVFMMDYRGYGMSTGTPSEEGMYEDVDACMQWLKGMGLSDDRLVAYGFSLGSAPATELTAKPRSMQPSKLIMEAPFASFDYMSQTIAKISMAGSYYGNLEIDNAEEIKVVEEPFLWIHGIEDAFIPIDNGERVIANYQGSHLVERRIPGGEHSTVPTAMGIASYIQLMGDFITGAI